MTWCAVLALIAPALATAPSSVPVVPEFTEIEGLEDQATEIVLQVANPDGSAVSFVVADAPELGEITGTGALRRYAAPANFHGRVLFSYVATDGEHTSAVGWVAIDVQPTQDVVIPHAPPLELPEDGSGRLTPTAEAAPGVMVLWRVATPPEHGTLVGPAALGLSVDAQLTYVPEPDFHGLDSFELAAFDAGSPEAFLVQVPVTVTSVHDLPGEVTPLSPSAGATVGTVRPTIQWSEAVDPDADELYYGVRVLDGVTQEVIADAEMVWADRGVVSWRPDVALRPGGVYLWEAWAAEEDERGPECPRQIFVVDPSDGPPAGLVLTSPVAGGQYDVAPLVEVGGAVDPEGGPVRYDIEVDASAAFDSPLVRSASLWSEGPPVRWDADFAGVDLPRFSEAYVRVRAVDAGGVASPWVVRAFQFGGDNLPPTVPLVEPVPDHPAGPCVVAVMSVDPEADRVRYELTLDPAVRGERTSWYPAGAPTAVLKCAEVDGVPVRSFVRAWDEHGGVSPWEAVDPATITITRGCAVLPSGQLGGGLVGLLLLTIRRRR